MRFRGKSPWELPVDIACLWLGINSHRDWLQLWGYAIQLNLFAEPRIEPLSANHLHKTFAVLSCTKVHLSADDLKIILELKQLVSRSLIVAR